MSTQGSERVSDTHVHDFRGDPPRCSYPGCGRSVGEVSNAEQFFAGSVSSGEEALGRGEVPPGRYNQGGRSPIVWVYLCPWCAGFAPMTTPDYRGALSGRCSGCGMDFRELHRFPAYISSAEGCNCHGSHPQVTGDLEPSS